MRSQRGALPPQLDEDRLHGVVALPLREAWQLLGVDGAVARVHAGQVDLADELDGGGLVGVLGAAVHLDAVDAVLVDGLDASTGLISRPGSQARQSTEVNAVASWTSCHQEAGNQTGGALT